MDRSRRYIEEGVVASCLSASLLQGLGIKTQHSVQRVSSSESLVRVIVELPVFRRKIKFE